MDFRWVWLPYCLMPLKDKRYVAVNRSYKFLGMQTKDFIDYEAAPAHARFKLTPSQAKKVSRTGEYMPGEPIYLYNDSCVPTMSMADWALYQAKLGVLAKAKVG